MAPSLDAKTAPLAQMAVMYFIIFFFSFAVALAYGLESRNSEAVVAAVLAFSGLQLVALGIALAMLSYAVINRRELTLKVRYLAILPVLISGLIALIIGMLVELPM